MEFPRIGHLVRIEVICSLSLVVFFLSAFLYCYYVPDLAHLIGECMCLVILLSTMRLLIRWIRTGPVPAGYLITRSVVLPVNDCNGCLSRKEANEFCHGLDECVQACCIDILGLKVPVDVRPQPDGTYTYSAQECHIQITDREIRDMLSNCSRFKNKSIYKRRSIIFLAICTSRRKFVNRCAYRLAITTAMQRRRQLFLKKTES